MGTGGSSTVSIDGDTVSMVWLLLLVLMSVGWDSVDLELSLFLRLSNRCKLADIRDLILTDVVVGIVDWWKDSSKTCSSRYSSLMMYSKLSAAVVVTRTGSDFLVTSNLCDLIASPRVVYRNDSLVLSGFPAYLSEYRRFSPRSSSVSLW